MLKYICGLANQGCLHRDVDRELLQLLSGIKKIISMCSKACNWACWIRLQNNPYYLAFKK